MQRNQAEMMERYKRAQQMHFSGVDQFQEHLLASSKCFDESLDLVRRWVAGERHLTAAEIDRSEKDCLAKIPAPPNDRRPDETFEKYSDRKLDEWAEKECFWQNGSLVGSIERRAALEKDCLRDLELKRIRRALEKLSG